MSIEPGQVLGGRYRIVQKLGEGSMGTVLLAENVLIGRRVAVKVLHGSYADRADTVRRFEREAQAAGRIGSEHIVEVLDLGELQDGSRFMVMELLEGMTLSQRIRSRGRLRPEEASPIARQILAGLAAAHDAGIIHRDLKPANVFLLPPRPGKSGEWVKILDFGVSKFSVLDEEMSLTSTGAVLGTPFYMSPEQAKGAREIDARSDLYSVGVILYECVTGQVPFSAETFNELIFRIVLESPPPAESFVPDLEPEFAALIGKAMARDAKDRFQTAAEFAAALAEWEATPHDAPNLSMAATLVMPPRSARHPQEAPTIVRGDVQEARTVVKDGRDAQEARTVVKDGRDAEARTVVKDGRDLQEAATIVRDSAAPPPVPSARRAPAQSLVLGTDAPAPAAPPAPMEELSSELLQTAMEAPGAAGEAPMEELSSELLQTAMEAPGGEAPRPPRAPAASSHDLLAVTPVPEARRHRARLGVGMVVIGVAAAAVVVGVATMRLGQDEKTSADTGASAVTATVTVTATAPATASATAPAPAPAPATASATATATAPATAPASATASATAPAPASATATAPASATAPSRPGATAARPAPTPTTGPTAPAPTSKPGGRTVSSEL